jgi:hypothetical protein
MATVDIRDQLGLEPLEDLIKNLNVLIYGPPNAGKTYLAATLEDHKELSPCCHLGFEKGLLTVAYRKNYAAKEIRTIGELEKVVGQLQDDSRSAKPYFKSLVIDNATELQNLDIDTVMRETKKLARNPENVDIDVPSPREWGKIGKRLRRAVVSLRDLPLHTVWTAWRGEYVDDADITHYFPKLAGHMKNEFSGYFDIVGMLQMDTKKVEGKSTPFTTLQIQETKRVKAKWRNRPDEVPDIIEMPTMPMIWEFVKQSKLGTG